MLDLQVFRSVHTPLLSSFTQRLPVNRVLSRGLLQLIMASLEEHSLINTRRQGQPAQSLL